MAAMSIHKNKSGKSQQEELQNVLSEMFQSDFYGSVEVKFEGGRVTIVRKTQSLKI